MWEPRRLTIPRDSTACYRSRFSFLFVPELFLEYGYACGMRGESADCESARKETFDECAWSITRWGMMCQAAFHPSRTAPSNTGWLVEVCEASSLNIPTSTFISILVNIFYFRHRLTESQITLCYFGWHTELACSSNPRILQSVIV
jgi:hypothetical protein